MIVTEDNERFYLMAMSVDFLEEQWEIDWYANALSDASAWGKKVDRENKEYFSKNHLIDKYNI